MGIRHTLGTSKEGSLGSEPDDPEPIRGLQVINVLQMLMGLYSENSAELWRDHG